MGITRRDFLNGVSLGVIAGLSPIEILEAKSHYDSNYYPPALTGLRGSHIGSFENAHKLGWEKKEFNIDHLPVEEKYDLVVVGAGISGLSAARFYQKKFGMKSKILILDNHDDFGGHAKRNEFKVKNKLILGYGGTESLQSPKSIYSKVALDLLKDISVNVDALGNCFNQNFYPNMGLSRGVFFDRETFGEDKLVSGDPGRAVADDIDPKRLNGRPVREFINDFPLSKEDRDALITMHNKPTNYLPGKSLKERMEYLTKTSYRDFLLKNVGLSQNVIKYFQARSNDFCAVGIESISSLTARLLALPGLDGMDLPPLNTAANAELNDPYIYHFPDGNASIARLLVRKMIPKVAPGNSMSDIVLAKFNYSKLDLPSNHVRIRLNSTVVTVKNQSSEVGIGYLDKNSKLHRIQAKHTVMACYNMMIPLIVKDLPAEQKSALSSNVKASLVYSKVVIRNWKAFAKLGVHEIYAPMMPYSRIKLDYPVNMGGYYHAKDPSEPMCLHMVYVPVTSNPDTDVKTKSRLARYKLFSTPFSDLELNVRQQLQRMLASGGFNQAKDILAITVNRWSHGYSYFHNSLYDDEKQSENIIKKARAPFGNVTIANSDSAWTPFTHAAIDMAYRAVNEFGSRA